MSDQKNDTKARSAREWYRQLRADPAFLHLEIYEMCEARLGHYYPDPGVRKKLLREVAARVAEHFSPLLVVILAGERELGEPPAALDGFDMKIRRQIEAQTDPAFLELSERDDDFLWMATWSIILGRLRKRFRGRGGKSLDPDSELLSQARTEVMARLGKGQKVLEAFRKNVAPSSQSEGRPSLRADGSSLPERGSQFPQQGSGTLENKPRTLEPEGSFQAYLRTSVYNAITDLQRTNKWTKEFWDDCLSLDQKDEEGGPRLKTVPAPRSWSDALKWLVKQKKSADIQRVLDAVRFLAEGLASHSQREHVLAWLDWMGEDPFDNDRTQSELARALGISSGTLNSDMYRFRKLVRKRLGDEICRLLKTTTVNWENQLWESRK